MLQIKKKQMVQKHTGPMLIIGSLLFLGLSLYFIISGVLLITNEQTTFGVVSGYSYTNNTCIVCSTVFRGYPNCKEYAYSGAVKLKFNNCSDTTAVNVCGSTPEKAEKNTEELYKLGDKLDGYVKNCKFHFFRANGWANIIIGMVFFSVFLFFLGLGIYFTRKYNTTYQTYQSY